jgi:hypothetical protein
VQKVQIFGNDNKNQTWTHEKIRKRLNSVTVCYHSAENVLSFRLLAKNVKITIHDLKFLPVVLYGCEKWFLTLREEHRLKVFENRVLRNIYGPKRDEVTEDWRKLHNDKFQDFTPHQLQFGCSTQGDRRGMWHIRGRGEVHTGFWWGNQRKRGNLKALCVNGRIILKYILNKLDGRACTGFIWLRRGKNGGLL